MLVKSYIIITFESKLVAKVRYFFETAKLFHLFLNKTHEKVYVDGL